MELKYFDKQMDEATLKKRWKKLAFQHHPDKGGDTATMQQINSEFQYCMEMQGVDFDADITQIRDFGDLMSFVFRDMVYRQVKIDNPAVFILETFHSMLNVFYEKERETQKAKRQSKY